MTMRAALLVLMLTPALAAAQEPYPEEFEDEAAQGDAVGDGAASVDPLDRLFDELADENLTNPRRVQARIGEIWSHSGSASMDLLLTRGREATEAEEYEKAVDHLTALTRLAPEFAEGWNARATAHYLNDEYWFAMADIQRALTIEPRHFGALLGLGVILERTGDERGALVALRAALAINPHLVEARQAVERLAPKVDGRDI
ncbi:MAG: hypothetical protein ACK4WC_06645 [Rubrimonas sp.]